ncbi:ESX secretion-associated protein EspG [Actinophytocola sp. NPDC049390]|uniref:ESX secretion-associated protein EspG n=1 Tax=Actinophytocola sp. NPDC049390 TaxID=3363894 RepID=UPI0037BDC6A6
MSDWISVSAEEMFLLWWAADLGEPPTALTLPRPGATPERRTEYAAQASTALRTRGLGTVHDPVQALATALRHIATGNTKLTLHTHGPKPAQALGVLTDRTATMTVRTGDEIRLREVTPGTLIEELLTVLPPLPAAPGWPTNIAVTDYREACRRGEATGIPGFVQALRAAGLREPDTATLVRAITTRAGGGQLGATSPTTRRNPTVTWVDTPAGRYAVGHRDGWVTITPADTTRLNQMAKNMITIR